MGSLAFTVINGVNSDSDLRMEYVDFLREAERKLYHVMTLIDQYIGYDVWFANRVMIANKYTEEVNSLKPMGKIGNIDIIVKLSAYGFYDMIQWFIVIY